MRADKLIEQNSVKMMIVGFSGTGKTGSLASLANAGMKLRMLDYDGNIQSLLMYTKPEFHKNIDIIQLEDPLRAAQKFIGVSGLPEAFTDGLEYCRHWKYKGDDGTEVDLGVPKKDWGPDTVLVLDSLTAVGRAIKWRAMAMLNKTPLNTTKQLWGLAMEDQNNWMQLLTSPSNRFHVIVMAHKKLITPKAVERDDDDVSSAIKQQVVELVPARYYPCALGQALPQTICEHFPCVIEAAVEVKNNKAKRVFNTMARPEIDLKVPADVPATLDIETGLWDIFQALGVKSPAISS